MSDRDSINMYTIYEGASDLPAPFVVRRWETIRGIIYARELVGQATTLEDARQLVPAGCMNLGRWTDDEPPRSWNAGWPDLPKG